MEKYAHIEGSIKDLWKYDYSFGQRFNNDGKLDLEKPIMFIRFHSSDDKIICRHPLSTSSLLEANATNTEYIIKFSLSQNLEPVEKKLASAKYHKDIANLLYHPDFTEYTAIAHITANTLKISDILETYGIASKIGNLVLNLPNAIYKKIDIKTVKKLIENNNIKNKIKYFIKNLDRGFAFYNLINIYNHEKDSVQVLLKSANLPNEPELHNIVLYQMENNLNRLINGPFKKMGEDSILNGIDIFKKRGLFGDKMNILKYITNKNILPQLLFGDTYFDTDKLSILDIQKKTQNNQEISPIEKYYILDFYENKCSEFIDACGY